MVNLDNYRLRSEINLLNNRITDLEETIVLLVTYMGLGSASPALQRIFDQNKKNKEQPPHES